MAENLQLKKISRAALDRVNEALIAGGLVCLPSDTVYGLAGLARHPQVPEKIYTVKSRERGKPLALVFGSVEEIFDSIPSLPDSIRQIIVKLMPGAVTVVVPAESAESAALGIPDQPAAGVRVIPPPLNKLYRALAGPLFVTSANISDQAAPRLAEGIPARIVDACDFIVDAGSELPGTPSTVVDLRPLATGGRPLILRPGPLAEAEIIKRWESCGCF